MGGSIESAMRAGRLGLPLMIAIIGGETRRFKQHVDAYKQAGYAAGFDDDVLKVGLHCLGYLAPTMQEAKNDFFPGYQEVFTKIGQERGWGPVTFDQFERYIEPAGALLVGDAPTVADKIKQHSKDLGGISRLTFQMNVACLPHAKLIQSMTIIAETLRPLIRS